MSAGAGGQDPVTVLVVEDDDDLRAALHHGLEAQGFAVRACPSAIAALAALEEDLAPDVVLLDWWLSEGAQGAAACRMLSEATGVPVVMHTGMDDVRDRAAAYRAGAVAFLQKGVPLDEVARRLRAAVADDRAA